jgi:acetoin utilization deacetylase AcuC-like enzyme
VPARPHGDEILRAVHDGGLLDHLAGVWAAWEKEGFPAQYGRDRVVPYVFPTPGMLGGLEPRTPPAVHGRAGLYCYDTMTLIGPGSWAAIRGAADAALTAADLIGAAPAGLRAVPATRPSRHP